LTDKASRRENLSLLVVFWLSILTLGYAWTKEDHEIFDLVQALEDAEGKGTTFYSILGVPPTASAVDIGKAYRKKSISMHPDKNPGVKDISERYARLGVIAKILRNDEDRERYDFFYKNGVPKWRGTGYYYSRFRPGLGSVVAFLILLTSVVEHGIAHINRQRNLQRIDRLSKQAKSIAYGPKGVPFEKGVKRKVRVPVNGGTDSSENRKAGRMVDLLVDGTDVYVIGSHEPALLSRSMAPRPRFIDTWAISLIRSLYSTLPFAKQQRVVTSTAQDGRVDVPEDDLTDGHFSEGNAESSDTEKTRKSIITKKRKPAGGKRK